MAREFEGLSRVPVVNGMAQQLQEVFPSEPILAVEKAVADGLTHALGDENINLNDVVCSRDFSQLCPEGWADAGDGNTCMAPVSYEGKCGPLLNLGGFTPSQKRQQAAKCGMSYACLDACTPDASKPCPLGWLEDVNHDCLAPVGYSGRCVGRKNFEGMRKTEKKLWADTCDVTWPCRRTHQDAIEVARMQTKGVFNNECLADYSKPCPEHFSLEGKLCQAHPSFFGLCGPMLSSKYSAAEKVLYAETCLTKWPCMEVFISSASI